MGVAHEPWLVVLSLIVAIQGAYVGLSLAVQVGEAVGLRRRLLLAAAAISLAVAIWAMHFVGMLAARLPYPVDYLVFPTLLSFLVCVIVVGTAVFAANAGPLTATRLAASAIFMGGGIATMHYIGMSALHASAHLSHARSLVLASVIVGIAASGLALWLASGRRRRPPLLLSAMALGAAIAGMHYTAMAGLTLVPFEARASGAPALSGDLLAIVVAIVAFIVSGAFLLTLVPDRMESARDDPGAATNNGEISEADRTGLGTFGPLGGVGAPRRRIAKQLPVERNGAMQFVDADDIIAVHANAHYTFVFDGRAKLFCPLGIGVVESRLDTSRFVRVHRSHIVNIGRVVAMKRIGDAGIIELAALEPYTVPVSRGRFTSLRSRLAATADDIDDGDAAAIEPTFATQHR
ncbi:MAG TPA: MHYT domain-containing protein [Alphaproteobacteria bacterium]|nr:MHYT domain-containing protein [Alphaproteobacteria bacterium]